jgi:DNA repair exonuclease SbcCD ATPase subunit
MRITHLLAENYKRLRAIEVTPEGALVDVKGRNSQGKTSLLDSIYAALAGASAIPSKPIRKGADKARIELTLGDGEKVELVVKRTFARRDDDTYTTSITVENADGLTHRSPQTLLDGLLGALSFDPLAFTRMSPKDQLQQLRKLVPDVDFDAIDEANRGDFERRTVINRQQKAAAAQLAALKIPGDPRQERIDEAELVAKLEQAGQVNADIEKRRANRERTETEAKRLEAESETCLKRVAELQREMEALGKRSEDARAAAAGLRKALANAGELPAQVDTAGIKEEIAKAREHNRALVERENAIKARATLTEEVKALEAESDALSAAINKRNVEKVAAVAAANLPVAGLAFGDDEVLLNDLPFDQASDAEKLRASVAIAAAMAPKLKVIRIRDGSLLDSDGVKALAEFAEKHGLQVWRECVADNATVGIVIEDGALARAEDAA